jgi:hypothetical protein
MRPASAELLRWAHTVDEAFDLLEDELRAGTPDLDPNAAELLEAEL